MSEINILLVEDNPGDVLLTRRQLERMKVRNSVTAVSDGDEAMAFLRREPPFEDAPRPDLVLLDLNLPRKDGREVLREMKGDPALRRIPVVVLTSSEADRDIAESYDLHANCYVKKPVNFEGLARIVDAIEGFWLSIVELPRPDERE